MQVFRWLAIEKLYFLLSLFLYRDLKSFAPRRMLWHDSLPKGRVIWYPAHPTFAWLSRHGASTFSCHPSLLTCLSYRFRHPFSYTCKSGTLGDRLLHIFLCDFGCFLWERRHFWRFHHVYLVKLLQVFDVLDLAKLFGFSALRLPRFGDAQYRVQTLTSQRRVYSLKPLIALCVWLCGR